MPRMPRSSALSVIDNVTTVEDVSPFSSQLCPMRLLLVSLPKDCPETLELMELLVRVYGMGDATTIDLSKELTLPIDLPSSRSKVVGKDGTDLLVQQMVMADKDYPSVVQACVESSVRLTGQKVSVRICDTGLKSDVVCRQEKEALEQLTTGAYACAVYDVRHLSLVGLGKLVDIGEFLRQLQWLNGSSCIERRQEKLHGDMAHRYGSEAVHPASQLRTSVSRAAQANLLRWHDLLKALEPPIVERLFGDGSSPDVVNKVGINWQDWRIMEESNVDLAAESLIGWRDRCQGDDGSGNVIPEEVEDGAKGWLDDGSCQRSTSHRSRRALSAAVKDTERTTKVAAQRSRSRPPLPSHMPRPSFTGGPGTSSSTIRMIPTVNIRDRPSDGTWVATTSSTASEVLWVAATSSTTSNIDVSMIPWEPPRFSGAHRESAARVFDLLTGPHVPVVDNNAVPTQAAAPTIDEPQEPWRFPVKAAPHVEPDPYYFLFGSNNNNTRPAPSGLCGPNKAPPPPPPSLPTIGTPKAKPQPPRLPQSWPQVPAVPNIAVQAQPVIVGQQKAKTPPPIIPGRQGEVQAPPVIAGQPKVKQPPPNLTNIPTQAPPPPPVKAPQAVPNIAPPRAKAPQAVPNIAPQAVPNLTNIAPQAPPPQPQPLALQVKNPGPPQAPPQPPVAFHIGNHAAVPQPKSPGVPEWVCCPHHLRFPTVEMWYGVLRGWGCDDNSIQRLICLSQFGRGGYMEANNIMDKMLALESNNRMSTIEVISAWLVTCVSESRKLLNPAGAKFAGMSGGWFPRSN